MQSVFGLYYITEKWDETMKNLGVLHVALSALEGAMDEIKQIRRLVLESVGICDLSPAAVISTIWQAYKTFSGLEKIEFLYTKAPEYVAAAEKVQDFTMSTFDPLENLRWLFNA